MTSGTMVKYAHLFVDGDDQYLFVKNLGNGEQSYTQLVLHIQTGVLRVRKVSVEQLDALEKGKDDSELNIITRLQERAREVSIKPNIVHLFSGGDVPAHQEQPGDPGKWHRVAYLSYMNGGHLNDFHFGCCERQLAVPRSLILRLVHQVASVLQFMYTKPAVLHRDLHSTNIFLHWEGGSELPDFYVGDFGRAIQADDEGLFKLWDVHAQELFEEGFQPYEADVQALLSHTRALLACPLRRTERGKGTEPEIVRQVMAKLDGIANPPMTPGRPPDLAGLLDLLSDPPATPDNPLDVCVFKFGLQDTDSVTPLYHDRLDECLQAREIHGPWYCAKVSLTGSGGPAKVLPDVLEVSDRTYHRPSELTKMFD